MSSAPGLKQIKIAPHTDERLKKAGASLHTAAGIYEVKWERKNNHVCLIVIIPYRGNAVVQFENGDREKQLYGGTYVFEYEVYFENSKEL